MAEGRAHVNKVADIWPARGAAKAPWHYAGSTNGKFAFTSTLTLKRYFICSWNLSFVSRCSRLRATPYCVAIHFGTTVLLQKRQLPSIHRNGRPSALDLLTCTTGSPEACVIVTEELHEAFAIIRKRTGTCRVACRRIGLDAASEPHSGIRGRRAIGRLGTGKSPAFVQYTDNRRKNAFKREGPCPEAS